MQIRLLSLLISLIFTSALFAQAPPPVKVTDPAAKAVLDKVRKKYEAYRALEVRFDLQIEIPEQPSYTQKGTLAQVGDQYRLNLPDQELICDGKSLWLVLKEKKEVQINDVVDDDENVLSPKDLLRIYEKEGFEYVLINEYKDKDRTIQQIEMKPQDRYADYSKIKLDIDKASSEIRSIKAFFKDGVRYLVTVQALTPNKSFQPGYFSFKKSDFPDAKVEDLRID